MKKLILTFLFAAALISASSQKVYFIYIQTESEQPFYVSMNEKMHSSTGTGYLILSKLVDSTYNFSIGFPQNKWPEQKFSVTINKKDQGFLLKYFEGKGWGLFNLQTLGVQMAANGTTGMASPGTGKTEVSEFTEMLSKAADDPSLKEKPVKPVLAEMQPAPEKKSEPKPEPALAKVQTTPVITEKPSPEKAIAIDNKDKPAGEIKQQVVEKKPEPKADQVMTQVEKAGKNPGIIGKPSAEKKITTEENVKPAVSTENINSAPPVETKIVEAAKPAVVAKAKVEEDKIPSANEKIYAAPNNEAGAKGPAAGSYHPSLVRKWAESSTTEGFGLVFIDEYNTGEYDTIRLVIPNPKKIEVPVNTRNEGKENRRFIDIDKNDQDKKEETTLTEVKPVITAVAVTEKKYSNNCTQVADESDFLLLRKRMAAKEAEADMIDEARKYFMIKCFTSEQIKNLGVLFLRDESRCNFFALAYQYVSDEGNFAVLQHELKDETYMNRFRAMLRN